MIEKEGIIEKEAKREEVEVVNAIENVTGKDEEVKVLEIEVIGVTEKGTGKDDDLIAIVR